MTKTGAINIKFTGPFTVTCTACGTHNIIILLKKKPQIILNLGIRVCGTERTNVVVSMTVGVGTLAVYSLVLLITQLTAADLNKNLIMISRKKKSCRKSETGKNILD